LTVVSGYTNILQTEVTANLAALPLNGASGTTISWSSDNTAVSGTGTVTRPAYGSGDVTVTLTATIRKNAASDTVVFNLTVKEMEAVIIFVPVTNITGVPTSATAGTSLTLSGTVVPSNATNQTIVWSLKNAGSTRAAINGNAFYATVAGTAAVTATVAGGKAVGTDYTQDFYIT